MVERSFPWSTSVGSPQYHLQQNAFFLFQQSISSCIKSLFFIAKNDFREGDPRGGGGTHVYIELLLSSSRNQRNIVKRPHTLKGRKEGRGTRAKVRSPEEEQRRWPETGALKNNKSRLQKNRQDQAPQGTRGLAQVSFLFTVLFCF